MLAAIDAHALGKIGELVIYTNTEFAKSPN
jgi:hypothetical protein